MSSTRRVVCQLLVSRWTKASRLLPTVYARADALARVAGILDTTRQVLALSRSERIPSGAAADRLALVRLRRPLPVR